MSKIYEALLRAEQDRATNVQSHPAETLADYRRTADAPSDLGLDQSAPFEPILNAPILDAPSVARPFTPIDVSKIRVVDWFPELAKLPALGERGSHVEQFRSLRTRLFGFRDLNQLKSVMVSSGLPREGKSFIAANLAISFARHKASHVLLIDGDMRRSSLHHLFGCPRSPGLTSYLSGKSTMEEVMQRAAPRPDGTPLFTGLGSLTFIGGGDEGDLAADLSGSARFKQLIESAGHYFDWIVVDSSPVNLVTDGVNLAAACDAVLMVTRAGVTKFESAQRALNELKSAKVLGIVLNAVDKNPSVNGYYGYYGYDGYDSYDPIDDPEPEPQPETATPGSAAQ